MWGLMSLCWNTINCGILKKFATKSQFTCGKTRPRLGQEYSSQTKTGPDQIILHSYCLVELQSLGQKKGCFSPRIQGTQITSTQHLTASPIRPIPESRNGKYFFCRKRFIRPGCSVGPRVLCGSEGGKAFFQRLHQRFVLLSNRMRINQIHIMNKTNIISILVGCWMLQQEKSFTFWKRCSLYPGRCW